MGDIILSGAGGGSSGSVTNDGTFAPTSIETSKTFTANGDNVIVDVSGMGTVGGILSGSGVTGGFDKQISVRVSTNGVDYYLLPILVWESGPSPVWRNGILTTSAEKFQANVAGFTHFKLSLDAVPAGGSTSWAISSSTGASTQVGLTMIMGPTGVIVAVDGSGRASVTGPVTQSGVWSVGTTDWLGSTAPTVGQKTMANSVPVVVASNQSAISVTSAKSATATTTQVADNAASTTLLASNASRLGASIENDSSAALFIKLGTTASTTDYTVKVYQFGYYEVPFGYTGRIDGIWATDPNDGAARITELT